MLDIWYTLATVALIVGSAAIGWGLGGIIWTFFTLGLPKMFPWMDSGKVYVKDKHGPIFFGAGLLVALTALIVMGKIEAEWLAPWHGEFGG